MVFGVCVGWVIFFSEFVRYIAHRLGVISPRWVYVQMGKLLSLTHIPDKIMDHPNTKHCVIALKFDNHYISILCYYGDDIRVGEILRTSFATQLDAEALVAKGDIANLAISPIQFCTAIGYTWAQAKPVAHETPAALAEYCLAVGGSHIHVFEGGSWDAIALIRTDQEIQPQQEATLQVAV